MIGPQLFLQFMVQALCFSVICGYSNLPPVFDMDMNQLTLRESTPVGSHVYTLLGHDPEGSSVRYGLLGTDHFSVDAETGEITVIKELDREREDTLKFFVTLEDFVSEAGTFGEVSNNFVKVAISVIILDDNDNIPRFMNLPYEAEAAEDVPIGTTVFSGILVTDPDSVGETLTVSCDVESNPEACDKFMVVGTSASQSEFRGAVVTKQLLNYDQDQIHQIEIYTTDGLFNSSSVVELRVQDIQDTPPIFSGSLSAVLAEDAPIGTLVMTFVARDGDKGAPREIRYVLVSDPFNFFTLDSVSGELRTGRPIDREILPDVTGVISITVQAQEVIGTNVVDDVNATTLATAFITVKDVNDSPPMFNQAEYSISIPENTPIGTPLPNLDMFVHDPDVGQNAVFSLRLQDVTGVFAIEPNQVSGSSSLSIRLSKGTLDYENPNQRKSIVLVIAEETQATPKHSSTATLTVIITDTNDNQPKFDRDDYSATISEDLAPGSYVTTINAADYDSGVFGKQGLVYQMFGSGVDLFNIDPKSGEITVADCPTPGLTPCLDFEDKSKYYLTLKATDDNGNGLSSVVSLLINLIDTNDNAPFCHPESQNVILDEDSTEFSIPLFITAKDVDVTSDIKYRIATENMSDIFTVDSFTGEVKLRNSTAIGLDNIFNDRNILAVEANDGMHSVICYVNFTIRDVNNNKPIFENTYKEVEILESAPLKLIVAKITANDSDAGRNSELFYAIQKGGLEDFVIDSADGTVTVARKLDFDRRNLYDIEIIAKDFGSPSLTGTATLVVNILNVNDKNPYFTPIIQSVEVLEDTEIGTEIYKLSAEDPDVNSLDALNFALGEPITAVDKNGNPITTNENYKDLFSVDNYTGIVSTKQKLRRESYAVLRITVIVTDTTAPTLQHGKGTLVVSIVSSNKYPPSFQSTRTHQNLTSTVQMLEEQPIGTILDTYTATDIDSSISSYAIIPPNPYFEVENTTGTVRTKRRIDFEEIKSVDFTIIVFDDGIPPLNTSMYVNVKIVNINDNSPVFNQSLYTMNITENAPAGTVLGEVFATDKDEGMFGDISYSLQGKPHDYFIINEMSGVISVGNTSVVDRESYAQIKLTALAYDNAPDAIRKTATTSLLINVLDENDNAPVFEHHIYHGSVDENIAVSPPTAILQVNAKDPDAGLNGTIQYSIRSGNEDGKFRLDPYNGILYPAKSLLNHTGQYILIIEAKDVNGTGTSTASTTISVFVAGINVHRPVFISPQLVNSTVQILENATLPGYLIMTVRAADEDFGENGRVTYHLKVSNKNVQQTENFMIDELTGELRIRQFIDRKKSSRFDLILVAKDQANHLSHETLRTLTVIIVGTNKYEPTFLVNYQFYLKENSEKHSRIGRVQALDQDDEPHAIIYYYLIMGNEEELFKIDKNDGTIYANAIFDREEMELYVLYIYASNDPNINITKQMNMMNSAALSDKSTTKVEIYITDENDNAPTFKKAVYYAGINSHAAPGDSVINVLAVDPDQGPNGSLSYSLDAVRLHRLMPTSSSDTKTSASTIGGALVPPPFSIAADGRITTAEHMLGYDQEQFILEVSAQEVAVPNRRAMAVVHVWVYNSEQLVRVIFSQPADEIYARQEEILAELANITGRLVVVDDIRYHVDSIGNVRDNWSDMYLHIVDPETLHIAPTSDVLHDIDEKYDQLTDYYAGYAVENIVPAFKEQEDKSFGSALGAVIALSVMMFIGAVALLVVCCSLRQWKYSAPAYSTNGMGELIEKQSTESINTTENPLWMEQKLKLYEEQELTMQVFSDPEVLAPQMGKETVDMLQMDNTYATINPLMRGTSLNASLDLNDDYATLSSSIFTPHRFLQDLN